MLQRIRLEHNVIRINRFHRKQFGLLRQPTNQARGLPIPTIGVTPASFIRVEVENRYDVSIPQKGRTPPRHAWGLSMVGRLKPGWTVERRHCGTVVINVQFPKIVELAAFDAGLSLTQPVR
jgi:hypothetical protein